MHSPYHPYTQALLDNIAEFGKNKRPKSTMPTLKGHIPSLQHLPVGCRLGLDVLMRNVNALNFRQ